MAARMGTNLRVIVIGLLLTVFLFGSPRVESGRCIGADRARIVRLFELFYFRIQEKIAAGVHNFRTSLVELRLRSIQLAIFVSRVQYKYESREAVRRLLASEVYQPDKIINELKTLVYRAMLIIGNTQYSTEVPAEWLRKFGSESLERWRHLFFITAGSFRTCQAVRQKSLKPCAALEPLGQELRPICESLAIRVGIIYSGHCSDEAIRQVAAIWGKEVDAVRVYCLAIKERKPEMCINIKADSNRGRILCHALASGEEKVCNNSLPAGEEASECRGEIRIRKAITGEIPPSALSDELSRNQLLLPSLLACRSGLTCEQIAFDLYDEQMATLKLF